jgi:hypothetical protein
MNPVQPIPPPPRAPGTHKPQSGRGPVCDVRVGASAVSESLLLVRPVAFGRMLLASAALGVGRSGPVAGAVWWELVDVTDAPSEPARAVAQTSLTPVAGTVQMRIAAGTATDQQQQSLVNEVIAALRRDGVVTALAFPPTSELVPVLAAAGFLPLAAGSTAMLPSYRGDGRAPMVLEL